MQAHIFARFPTTTGRSTSQKWAESEPQDLQMPHMNNLDLDFLPEMMKYHSALLKSYSNKMAPEYKIWRACGLVWCELESYSIA